MLVEDGREEWGGRRGSQKQVLFNLREDSLRSRRRQYFRMHSVDERRGNDSVRLNYSGCPHRRRRCPYCRIIDETSLAVNEGYFSGFVFDSVAAVLRCLDWLVEEFHCQVRTVEKRCRQYTRRSRCLCRSNATIDRWRTTDGTDRSCNPVWNRLFRSFVCVWIRRRRPMNVL